MNPLHFSGRRRTPVLLQTEAAECGLACLGMVAGFHGLRTDLPSLRRQFSLSSQGLTLAQLLQLAASLDLQGRPLRVELDALGHLQLPAVLHWDFNHFVVLTEVRHNQLVLHDPALGKMLLTLSEASKHFTGVALELTPTNRFKPREQRQQVRLSQLLGKLPGSALAITQILLLALVLELFALIAPWFTQLVLDQAVVSADRDLLQVLAIGFLLLALFKVAVEALRSWVVLVLGSSLNLQLLGNLFRHMLRLSYGFFEKRHLGDVVSRFESLSAIQRTLTGSFLEALIDGVMAMATAVMLLVYSPKLSLIVACAALLYGGLRLALFLPLRLAAEDKILRGAKQQSNLLETLRGMQSLKLFNREQQRSVQFNNLVVDHFNADIRMQKLHLYYRLGNGLLFGVENILVIWLGASLILDQRFSIGMLIAFLAYKDQFTSRLVALIEKAIEFRMLGLHAERVADIALQAPESAEDHNLHQLNSHSGTTQLRPSLQVEGLGFAYGDTLAPVLRDINLEIRAGESVAIVGASGCGKTTLVKLLLGLLSPSHGEIRIGGMGIQQLGLSRYRSLVGSVMQDDQLFAGSLADNICFFDPQADLERMQQCAQMAAVHGDILAMPMAYNTLIGDMGAALSGGQRQRILLARALYKQPKILVLDEATSHLDVAKEKQVNEAIRQLKLTRIIVAHRPEAIASADRVIVLQNGTAQCLQVQTGGAEKNTSGSQVA